METSADTVKEDAFENAVREYRHSSKHFESLLKYRDGIAELRRKRASLKFISELLQANGVSISRQTVGRFCARFVNSRKSRRRQPASNGHSPKAVTERAGRQFAVTPKRLAAVPSEQQSIPAGPWTSRRKGPRIPDSKNL
jgi:hypothetical protein